MRAIVLCALSFFAFCLFALPAWSGDENAARALLQSCSEKADEDAVGMEKLEAQCPGLYAAFVDLGFAGSLQRGWQDTLDVAVLDDVLALHARYSKQRPSTGLHTDSLHRVLAGLKQPDTETAPSLWERFKAWLRSVFGSSSQSSPPWLEKLLERLTLSAAVMRIVVYGLIAMVIGMAIAVVVNELRAAGVFGKRVVTNKDEHGGSSYRFGATVSIGDFDAAPWSERPTILLRLIVARLIELRRLQAERSLTHRELSRRVQLSEPKDRERFQHLALLAESLRFGRQATRTESFEHRSEAVVGEARVLLDELNARPVRPVS